jgi:hypothetical protein
MSIHIPFEPHGRCHVALICLKGQPRRAYHFSKTIGEEESWAIRDYLAEEILRSANSNLTASELERLVTYAERAEYRAVGQIQNWRRDCKVVADRHYGSSNVDVSSPNGTSLGAWRQMDRNGS